MCRLWDGNENLSIINARMLHPVLPHIEADLLEREQIRSSAFRVSGFGAEDYTLKRDQLKPWSTPQLASMLPCLYPTQGGLRRDPLRRSKPLKGLASCLWKFLKQSDAKSVTILGLWFCLRVKDSL